MGRKREREAGRRDKIRRNGRKSGAIGRRKRAKRRDVRKEMVIGGVARIEREWERATRDGAAAGRRERRGESTR
jgi:hypothetical protein